MTSTPLGLASRPQNSHNRLPDGASTFGTNGTLRVKTSRGDWVTYPRYVADDFAARCGVELPRRGIRIEVTNPAVITPRTLTIKLHRGLRLPLIAYVHKLRKCEAHAASLNPACS